MCYAVASSNQNQRVACQRVRSLATIGVHTCIAQPSPLTSEQEDTHDPQLPPFNLTQAPKTPHAKSYLHCSPRGATIHSLSRPSNPSNPTLNDGQSGAKPSKANQSKASPKNKETRSRKSFMQSLRQPCECHATPMLRFGRENTQPTNHSIQSSPVHSKLRPDKEARQADHKGAWLQISRKR